MGGGAKAKRLAVSLSEAGGKRLDGLAEKHGISRAAIIETLLERHPAAATENDFALVAHRLRYAAAEAQKAAATERAKQAGSDNLCPCCQSRIRRVPRYTLCSKCSVGHCHSVDGEWIRCNICPKLNRTQVTNG